MEKVRPEPVEGRNLRASTSSARIADRRHFWVQAPVPAMDVDGLAVVTVGTALFGVASVVLAFAYEWLAARGHGSWLQISVAGFALGLIGLAYCWRRRRRRRAVSESRS